MIIYDHRNITFALDELYVGDTFIWNDELYIKTDEFKKDNGRYCNLSVRLVDGVIILIPLEETITSVKVQLIIGDNDEKE